MKEHQRDFDAIMKNCVKTTKAFNSEKLYRPIDREVMRVNQE